LTTSTTSTTPNLSFNASNTGFSAGASISGNYLQSLLQNKSGTAGASTNYVLSNDLGTDSTYYGEFGMNSSVFSASTPSDFFSINNGVYFSGHDGDLTYGSGNGFKSYFAWGATANSAHVINASGALGFSTNLGTTPALSGTTGFGTSGQALISAGSAAAPAWGTLPITGGGTGVATLTGLAYGNGTSAFTAATAAQVVAVISTTAVANATAAVTFSSTTQNSQFNSVGVGTAGSGTAGEIRATNNVTAYYSSDRRLKENIQDVNGALDKVCAIGSKTFDWTEDYIASKGGEDGYFVTKSDFGVVAQDVQEVLPQAVRTRQDGTLAVDYEKLATLAFGAIKELVKRVEALEAK
jgi:hypothetical protein